MKKLIAEIRACTICKAYLPHGCNPIFAVSGQSRIIIIGQAPGKKVHENGVPWNDLSGENLRTWLGVTREEFYNNKLFALIPMGFCYPGKGRSGDLPPRPECAPAWHEKLFRNLKNVNLTILIGQYSQDYYLSEESGLSLTETVRSYKKYLPDFFPLPHPSPRNNIWQSKNKWFASMVLPDLKKRVRQIIS